MNGKIINLWSDVIEIEFPKENLPKVNYLLTLHNGKTHLLVKRILNDTTVRGDYYLQWTRNCDWR
ncbi:hypothetical protein [Mycoplasmopsis cynos]|uniref:hypothetical protein n=1 Tax=Mycoplasmopsis cynos TaxID=171284 RepID=UPI003A5C8702